MRYAPPTSATPTNAALALAHQRIAGMLRWEMTQPDCQWHAAGPLPGWTADIQRIPGDASRGLFLGVVSGPAPDRQWVSEHPIVSLSAATSWATDQLLLQCYLRAGALPPAADIPADPDPRAVLAVVEAPVAGATCPQYQAIVLSVHQGATFRFDSKDPVLDLEAALAVARRWRITARYNYTNLATFARANGLAWCVNAHGQVTWLRPEA